MTRRRGPALVVAGIAAAFVFGLVAASVVGSGGVSPPAPSEDASAERSVVGESTSPATVAPERSAEFARDEAGARSAAIAYASAPQRWLYLDDGALEAAVREVASTRGADLLVAEVLGEVGLARDGLARAAGRVWWLVRPLAWRVEHYTPERAQVSVWTVSVLSAADVAMPQADWARISVELVWEDGDWRVDEVADVPGPTPVVGGRDQPWQPEPFDEALAGFERIRAEAGR